MIVQIEYLCESLKCYIYQYVYSKQKILWANSSKGIAGVVALQPEGEVVKLIVKDKTVYLMVLGFYTEELAQADVAVHSEEGLLAVVYHLSTKGLRKLWDLG